MHKSAQNKVRNFNQCVTLNDFETYESYISTLTSLKLSAMIQSSLMLLYGDAHLNFYNVFQ